MRRKLAVILILGGCASAPAPAPEAPPVPLLQLFDQARFGDDDEALARLWSELDLEPPPTRGAAATSDVIMRLRQRLTDEGSQRLLEADAALLAGDAMSTPEAALALRSVAGGADEDLSAAAMLRLFSLCSGSLRAAAKALGPQKAAIANRCLYAVGDSDPAPYFAIDPAQRPPDPAWRDMLESARALLGSIGPDTPWRAIADSYARAEVEAIDEAAARMPPTIMLDGVPKVIGAAPYDRTPVITVLPDDLLLDSMAVPDGEDQYARQVLKEALAEDRRGRVTVVAIGQTPWSRVLYAARLAARSGAIFVDLGVASPVVVNGVTVQRLAGVPLAAWTLRGRGPAPQVPRDIPRGVAYDPARAQLKLTLVVDERGARLVGARGEIPGTTAEALRDVRRAFPEETGLLVWAKGVTYAEVMAEVVPAQVVFPAMALASERPKPGAR